MAAQRYALNKNKYLLTHELDRLRQILEHFKSTCPRDCLLLNLALSTGGRATELLRLKKEDYSSYDQMLFIRGIKGSNDRELPLREGLARDLERYCEAHKASDLIFGISYNRLWQIWEHFRPTPKKFHSLRHSFAIELYQKSKDIRLLQYALGHRNISNTMVYAEYLYSRDELKKLML